MKKRMIALLLCCVMVLTLSPSLIATAAADDDADAATAVEEPVAEPKAEPVAEEEVKERVKEQDEETKEETKAEETKAEETKAEETKAEETKAEETKAEETKAEEQVKDPKVETKVEIGAEFDAAKAKSEILALSSVEAAELYFGSLTEAQQTAVLDLFTEAEIEEFANKLGVDLEIEVITPAVDYTDVGPLMDAVQTAPKRKAVRSTDSKKDDGLILSKTAKYDPKTKTVTITMEAYTTGTVITSSHSTPVDVVLVLDESGSMDENMKTFQKVYSLNKNKDYYVKSGDSYIRVYWCDGLVISNHGAWCDGFHFFIHWGSEYKPMTSENDTNSDHVQFYEASNSNQTKRAALISAATAFADKVYKDATDNKVDHRISVIGFSSNSNIKIGLEDDIRDNLSDVKTAISGLGANGGTYIEEGLKNAKDVFDSAAPTSDTVRKRVVVVFTDGKPGSGNWNNATISNSANPAISTAKTLKGTYGATVYTIGMLDDANPTLAISDESNDTARTNKFLHYVSSNYPNASSMSDGGSGSNAGYYLAASDMSSLTAIFTKISEEISTPSIQLDEKTVIRDIITPQFTVPANTQDIKLYTDDYDGKAFRNAPQSANGVTAKIEGSTVIVTDFDFNANFVSKTKKSDGTFGKKLIIEFTVKLREGFLGGNNVPTNGDTSGVYDKEGKEVKKFDVPAVNIPIEEVNVTAQDKNVYLLGEVTAEQLKSGATVTVGGVPLDLSKASDTEKPWGLDPWQTAYVNISVAVQDEAGNEVTAGLDNLKEDTTYTIKVTVTPKPAKTTSSGTPAENKFGKDDAKINVFTPVVTFKDSQITLGESADYTKDNFVSAVWKHDETESTKVTMIGEKPQLMYDYAPIAGIFKTDTPVKATVKIKDTDVTDKDTDVTDKVTFVREECTIKDNCSLDAKDGQFIVHVKPLSLTIKKTVESELDANQSFVFVVSNNRDDDLKIAGLEVIVHGNGSVTLNGLPTGTYTVTEKTDWSWRYTPTANDREVKLPAANDSVTFANTRNKSLWLTGGTYCDNRFGGQGTTVTPTSN